MEISCICAEKCNFGSNFSICIPKVLTDIILRYLESNRRLVIPQLGAFVVKEPGVCILFSEMLRRDDGVLRNLLCEQGMTELEAAGVLDRFVFEVRHALHEGRRYPMAHFGELYADPDGSIHFEYAPHTVVEEVSADRHVVHASAEEAPRVAHPQPAEEPAARPRRSAERSPLAHLYDDPSESHARSGAAGVEDEGTKHSAVHHEEEDENADGKHRMGALHRRGRSHEVAESDIPDVPVSKLRADPSVKGLRYGKPVKTTDAYTYVGAVPRRRFDRLIIVAIAAAVIALAAITYGYIRGRQAARADAWSEEWVDESMLPAGEDPGADAVEQPLESEIQM